MVQRHHALAYASRLGGTTYASFINSFAVGQVERDPMDALFGARNTDAVVGKSIRASWEE